METVGQIATVIVVIAAFIFGIVLPLCKFEVSMDEYGDRNASWLFIPVFTLLLALGVLGAVGYNNLMEHESKPAHLILTIPGLGEGPVRLDPQGQAIIHLGGQQ